MPRPGFLLLNDCARAGLVAGVAALLRGDHPLDVVETALREAEVDRTERSVGGNGRPNLLGQVELDAGIMDGRTRRAGGVAALSGFRHPISVARQVMERLPHVLLVGAGAACFAQEVEAETASPLSDEAVSEWQGWLAENLSAPDRVRFPETPLAPIAWRGAVPEASRRYPSPDPLRAEPREANPRDTAIALAGRGEECASATSTSGWAFKYPGRVGDSALPGCGHYADARSGVAACTHTGEMAIRAGTSRAVVFHLAAGQSVAEACRAAIVDVRCLEGGFLDELVIHLVDQEGSHCVATTGIDAFYWWWREGMPEPTRLPALRM